MTNMQFKLNCDVCNHEKFDTEEVAMTGKWSRLFNYSNKVFVVVACTNCGHSRFFRKDSRFSILELLTG